MKHIRSGTRAETARTQLGSIQTGTGSPTCEQDVTTLQRWHHFLSLSKRCLTGTVYIMQIKVDYWHLLWLKNIQQTKNWMTELFRKLLETTSSRKRRSSAQRRSRWGSPQSSGSFRAPTSSITGFILGLRVGGTVAWFWLAASCQLKLYIRWITWDKLTWHVLHFE